MKKYDDYSVFGENIGALVKITSYNMQYNHRDTVNKKYGEYKQAFNSLRGEFGLDPVKDAQGYKTSSNWGNNGPDLYSGNNDALKSHSYNAQNTYGANIKSVTYAVDTNGRIIQELSPEQVKPYIKEKAPISGVKALRDMGVEDEKIQDYIKRETDLHMRYKNFESNSILWIAATINGEKIIYINDKLMRAVNGINIAPEDFIAIAKKRYQEDLATLQEMSNRFPTKMKLTESELRFVVKEAALKILKNMLSEGRPFKNNQHYTHFAVSKRNGKILNGWDYKGYDPEELRQFKEDYFNVDLRDYGFDPKNCRILTYKYLVRNGLNPDDNSNWANNDEANADFVG